jgi:hypothetical protein
MKKYLLGILFALLASTAHAYDWRTAIMADNAADSGGGGLTASIIEAMQGNSTFGGEPTQTANVGDVIVLGVFVDTSSAIHATATLSGALASAGFVEKAFIGSAVSGVDLTILVATITTAGVPYITPSGNYRWGMYNAHNLDATSIVAATLLSTSANPFVTPVTTTAKSSIFAFSGYILTTTSYNLTSQYYDGTNYWGTGYALNAAAGTVNYGVNGTALGNGSILAIVAIPNHL